LEERHKENQRLGGTDIETDRPRRTESLTLTKTGLATPLFFVGKKNFQMSFQRKIEI
jgi:hypothetical protein